jgi:hypothetical protein
VCHPAKDGVADVQAAQQVAAIYLRIHLRVLLLDGLDFDHAPVAEPQLDQQLHVVLRAHGCDALPGNANE